MAKMLFLPPRELFLDRREKIEANNKEFVYQREEFEANNKDFLSRRELFLDQREKIETNKELFLPRKKRFLDQRELLVAQREFFAKMIWEFRNGYFFNPDLEKLPSPRPLGFAPQMHSHGYGRKRICELSLEHRGHRRSSLYFYQKGFGFVNDGVHDNAGAQNGNHGANTDFAAKHDS